MTKNTWKNIYNFDSSDSAFDFNDIASSISETTKSENVIKRNILIGGTEAEYETVPLILSSNLDQSGGNQEELVSTEQLENKLRDIFTGLDEPNLQEGGNYSEFSPNDIDTVITENLQTGGENHEEEKHCPDCGEEEEHEHTDVSSQTGSGGCGSPEPHEHDEVKPTIVNVPLSLQIGSGGCGGPEPHDHEEKGHCDEEKGHCDETSQSGSGGCGGPHDDDDEEKGHCDETSQSGSGGCGGPHDDDDKCHHVPLTLNL